MDDALNYTDDILIADLKAVQDAVQAWATARDIWFDCGFKSYREHVDGEPFETDPVVCVQYYSSDFEWALYGDLESEFSDLLAHHGFCYELASAGNIYYYPQEGPRSRAYAQYFRWLWVCSLVQEDFADIYEELYSHFATHPHDLHRLGWRDYEILLARIFQTQGFSVELGPGQGDGGVDIRLLQRDPIGDILTLVQAKKYSPRNKIGLETVQAITGAAFVEGANGMVVTTSSYLPGAREFAARTSGRIDLMTSDHVVSWCQTAESGIIRDKSTLVSRHAVERLLLDVRQRNDSRVLHSSWGYNSTHNSFAVILKETRHAALLMSLPGQNLTDDGYGQRGTEAPLIDASALGFHRADTVWRVKKRFWKDGTMSFWDGANLYQPWDGRPVEFDYYD
ncbi:restriction endonuclease-like protein (plasmid) [Rhizobium phaseoli]|uniref:restriction endonuclease n=1 Tax=Rhizobium phaseoli TaxID=396 RepID=UPI0007EA0844|nr:restriction endonuclease [Rhizobium phaseoli]ANL51079.1 restriction endonuclease-like protein [Rhizobium phaseoli]